MWGSVIEADLNHPPPRRVRLDRAGVRQLAVTLAVAAIGAAVIGAFFSAAARSRWLDGLFVMFAAVGALWIYRMAVVWISRFHLVRQGRIELGVVIEKVPLSRRRSRYVAWYSADEKQWSVEGLGAETAAEVVDAVTVLRLPGDPSQSLIYRPATRPVKAPEGAAPQTTRAVASRRTQ